MADKEVLERMLSMLPEEFQDIYDDTIPEAKEIRKKMGKKVSSVKSYVYASMLLCCNNKQIKRHKIYFFKKLIGVTTY